MVYKFFALSQELTCEDGNSGGSITNFLILSFGDFDEDFGSRIIDMHGPEDSGSIIGDSDGLVFGSCGNGDKNFIHTSGAEGSFDEIGYSNGTDKR